MSYNRDLTVCVTLPLDIWSVSGLFMKLKFQMDLYMLSHSHPTWIIQWQQSIVFAALNVTMFPEWTVFTLTTEMSANPYSTEWSFIINKTIYKKIWWEFLQKLQKQPWFINNFTTEELRYISLILKQLTPFFLIYSCKPDTTINHFGSSAEALTKRM